ncbi:hypothetical protein KKC17_01555 [Patescibacteria group bacterium]|nr:hypothetical protein [Patescibacteria group bacterium]
MSSSKSGKNGKFVKNLSLEEKQMYAVFLYQRFVFLEDSIYEHYLKNRVSFTANHYRVYLKIFYLLKKAYYRAKNFGIDMDWPGEPRLLPNGTNGYYSSQKTVKILLGSFMFLLREINGAGYQKIPAVVAGIKKIKYFHNKALVDYKKTSSPKILKKEEYKINSKDGGSFVPSGLYC